ncbi:BAG family molecular chaperone regulator 1 [Coffea eugenioides]|uniref:BAG family molecular chaperone regulator 1 n=1 Tax=Coffea eugenioides TaxID=49369 RepID=UPI000F60D85E|nr:BAG family molecular chaperone regulator 1 [Coffea eugenioides]
MKLMKLRSKKFSRSNSNNNKPENGGGNSPINGGGGGGEIKWEVRPGGMLVQKREQCGDSSSNSADSGEGLITLRVSTVSKFYDISVQSTSTFGELKLILSLVTNLEPNEQRLLFKGKEREDCEYLHMVGVRDKDKVLLLEDPALKERKKQLLGGFAGVGSGGEVIGSPYRTISV